MGTEFKMPTTDIRSEICNFSRKTEDVLLLLLKENEDLREGLQKEIELRENENAEIRELFTKECENLREKLDIEEKQRKNEKEYLQGQIDKLDKERTERIEETKQMGDYFHKENEDRKKNLEDINEWIRTENEKRMAEAEALRARMEREKQELQDFLERDNKAMRDRMSQEEEERQRKEREMQERMKEQQAASENEIIQLYKKMAKENQDRIREIEDLNARLAKEKDEIRERLEKEKEELRIQLEKENAELKSQLEDSRNGLKNQIDGNHFSSTNHINDLAEKLAKMLKDLNKNNDDILTKLFNEGNLLRNLMGQPLSVFFCANRSEDYETGGEEYLTFDNCYANLGGGMDPQSGIFRAPKAGAYMFIVHVCTADMHKALLSLRMNGNEIASFYDQNHESNHKNSMVGQSVLLNLNVNDKVQVYMFTHTGLQDKRSNHLTQFVGIFLRPDKFLEDCEPPTITNGIH